MTNSQNTSYLNIGYMKKIAILASGGGSNMQSIVDSVKNGILKGLAEVVLVISNNANAYALDRAAKENIKAVCVERKKFSDEKLFNAEILKELKNAKADIVCLAGYMRIVGKDIIDAYPHKVLNIHPALLPKFGGKGMYGHHVHAAVVSAKEKKSGATVHFADEHYDTGNIILQKEVLVHKTDTPEDVAKRVLAVEHQIYPEAIRKVIKSQDIKGYIIHVRGDSFREKHMKGQIKDIGIFCDFVLDGNQEDLTKEVIEKNFGDWFLKILNPGWKDNHFNYGTASCTYKHLLGFRDVVNNNLPYGIAFENDIILDKNFTEIIFKALDEIKARNLKNIVISLEDTMLKYIPKSKRVKGQLIYRNPGMIRFAGAYLFDLEFAKNMINHVDTKGCDDVIDWYINRRDKEGLIDIYWLHPTIAAGGSATGDIGSYFGFRSHVGFLRKISFKVQRAYKKFLWNMR